MHSPPYDHIDSQYTPRSITYDLRVLSCQMHRTNVARQVVEVELHPAPVSEAVATAAPTTDDDETHTHALPQQWQQRRLPFDLLIPQSTRGALLSTYLLGVPWTFLSKAAADSTCRSVAERAAKRFCRSEQALAISAEVAEAVGAVAAGRAVEQRVNASLWMERTSLRRPWLLQLTFVCSSAGGGGGIHATDETVRVDGLKVLTIGTCGGLG